MEMYCRDCKMNVKVRKESTKNSYTKAAYYYCMDCGVIVSIIYENQGWKD